MTTIKIQIKRILTMMLILVLLVIPNLKENGFNDTASVIFPLTRSVKAQFGNLVENPNVLSTSYYINQNISLQTLGSALGTQLAQMPGHQDEIVILDFGFPNVQGGVNGADLFIYQYFISWSDIGNLVETFLNGFHSNTYDSITVLIGLNNSLNYYPNINAGSHGTSWNQLVNQVSTYVTSTLGANNIFVYGAIDIEQDGIDFNTTQAWINGYGVFNLLYNFGAAENCPTYDNLDGISGHSTTCKNNWTYENIYQVSYGQYGYVYVLPEILSVYEDNAEQWYDISGYGYINHQQHKLNIMGSLTDYQACIQRQNCNLTDNSPIIGNQQLYKWLNHDLRTKQSVYWSSDIYWING